MTSSRQLALLAMSIFIGIAFPTLAAWFAPLLMPAVFVLFLLSIAQIRFGDAIAVAFRQHAAWIILLWQIVLLPLLAAFALKPWLNDELYLFAVASLCSCAITATTALSRLLGLNDALALVVGISGSVLMPLPLYLFLTHGTDIDVAINLAGFVYRVAFFIGLPFVLVYAFRQVASESLDSAVREYAPNAALITLVVFGLAVMDGVQALTLADPWLMFSYVLLSFALNIGVQLLTWVALRFLGTRDATTAALVCAYRNLGIIAAIAGGALGAHFLIFVGVWQLPMYTLPLLLRRYYLAQSPFVGR